MSKDYQALYKELNAKVDHALKLAREAAEFAQEHQLTFEFRTGFANNGNTFYPEMTNEQRENHPSLSWIDSYEGGWMHSSC